MENSSKLKHGASLKRKRAVAIISITVTLALMCWMGWYVMRAVNGAIETEGGLTNAAKHFRDLIRPYGSFGLFIAFLIQLIQVVVPTIPGEVFEVGMGICFGWAAGTLICSIGTTVGAFIILVLTKKYGVKLVELFVSLDKLNEMKLFNNENRLKLTVFLLYLIPGTPKDSLVFFFGLTKIRTRDFLWIQAIARIPTIITSTIAGDMATEQRYTATIIIFALTGLFALIGMLLYRRTVRKKQEINENQG